MVMKKQRKPMNEWLEIFREYCEETGKTLAEIKRTEEYKGYKIGEKISNLKVKYKMNGLTPDEINALDDLKIAWNVDKKKAIKEEIEFNITHYKDLYNDLVSLGYEKPYNKEEIVLLVEQLDERRKYIIQNFYGLGKEKVSITDIAKEMNFSQVNGSKHKKAALQYMIELSKGNNTYLKWEQWEKLFEEYVQNTGENLSEVKTTESYKGYSIGRKIPKYRKAYKNNKLDNDQIQLLEKLGIVW